MHGYRKSGNSPLVFGLVFGHLGSHEHLVPHFKEPYQVAPGGVEAEQGRRFGKHSVWGSLSVRLGKKEDEP